MNSQNKCFQLCSIKCRAVLFFILGILCISKSGSAQTTSFTYTLYSSQPVGINDVVESDDGYVLVGWRETTEGLSYPYFFRIDMMGNFLNDSTINDFTGFYSNILTYNTGYLLSLSTAPLGYPDYISSLVIETNSNLQMTVIVGSQDGSIENSKLIDDTTLVTIGTENYDDIDFYIASVKLYNLNSFQNYDSYIDLFGSDYPIDMYEIIKFGNGYRIFTKSPQSIDSDGVTMFTFDLSFNIISVLELETSYNDFNTQSKLTGPVTAMTISDSTIMVHGVAPHPLSENEENNLDAATLVLNESNEELQLNFTDVPDTNAYASIHSIAKTEDYFYFGDTKNYDGEPSSQPSYFMLTKTDLNGNVLWTKYYGNGTNLKLTNIITTSDGGVLMVGDSYISNADAHNIYVVKIDANGNLNSILSPDQPTFSSYVFPNPSTSNIHFSLPEFPQEHINLEIYDSTSKLIRKIAYHYGDILNVLDYDAGVYFYRLTGDNVLASGKFVVAK